MEDIIKPYIKLSGTNGNVFAIIGKVIKVLKKAGLGEKAKEFQKLAMAQHSYDDVLILVFDYCDVE